MFCGQQELALRGRRDQRPLKMEGRQRNDGIFKALLRFRVDAGDVKRQCHLDTAKRNATYLMKQQMSQQESSVMFLWGMWRTAKFVRGFSDFVMLAHMNAKGIATIALNMLREIDLDIGLILGQRYDGASTTSGQWKTFGAEVKNSLQLHLCSL